MSFDQAEPGFQMSTNLSVLTYATPTGTAYEHRNTENTHDIFQTNLLRGTNLQGIFCTLRDTFIGIQSELLINPICMSTLDLLHGSIAGGTCSASQLREIEVTPAERRRATMKANYARLSAEKKKEKLDDVVRSRLERMTHVQGNNNELNLKRVRYHYVFASSVLCVQIQEFTIFFQVRMKEGLLFGNPKMVKTCYKVEGGGHYYLKTA